jgi:hypothetical protein
MTQATDNPRSFREKVSVTRRRGTTITMLGKSLRPLNVHADNPIWAKLDEALREKGK